MIKASTNYHGTILNEMIALSESGDFHAQLCLAARYYYSGDETQILRILKFLTEQGQSYSQ